jgi:ferredoxin
MALDLLNPAVPTIDRQRCNGCAQCAQACPTETLAVEEGQVRVARRTFLGCFGCGQCMTVCPTGAVTVRGRRLAPEDVVDVPAAASSATADQLDALLLSRRSMRKFDQQEIDRALIDRILAMTATAPVGIPPTGVGIVVFAGRDKVRQFVADSIACFRRLQRMLGPWVLPLMRPLLKRTDYVMMRDFVRPLLRLLVEEWDKGVDAFCYDAPAALLFHHAPDDGPADCHIATTYAMLAAQSLGLGSCMLGTSAALEQDKAFKAKYGIPARNKMGLALTLGYPAVSYRRSLRRQLASVAFA